MKTDNHGANDQGEILSPKAQTPLSPHGGEFPISPSLSSPHDLLLDNQILSPKKLSHPLSHADFDDSPVQVEAAPPSHDSPQMGASQPDPPVVPEQVREIASLKMVPALGDSPGVSFSQPSDVALADSPLVQSESPAVEEEQGAQTHPDHPTPMQTDSPSASSDLSDVLLSPIAATDAKEDVPVLDGEKDL